MGLVNTSLVIGGLLVAVPVVLHLLMRPKPQSLVFPAIRFIVNRRESNVRKLKLRHWLLLAMRCLAILLLAFALARPSVVAETYGPWLATGFLCGCLLVCGFLTLAARVHQKHQLLVGGMASVTVIVALLFTTSTVYALRGHSVLTTGNRLAPVATVMVFDTAIRMQYRSRNQTRLDVARETGFWILDHLPRDSQLAILESRVPTGRNGPTQAPAFCLDLSAARRAIERLETTGDTRSLWRVIEEAVGLLEQSDLSQQEIFIFTDLTRTAWLSQEEAMRVGKQLREKSHIALHVIDVGAEQARNVRLGELRLSTQTAAFHQPLEVSVNIHHLDVAEQRTIELLIEEATLTGPLVRDGATVLPPARPRGQQLIQLDADRDIVSSFPLPELPIGIHHGSIRVREPDGLLADNQRYFSVEIRDQWPLLVVAPNNINTHLFTEALSPKQDALRGGSTYDCHVVRQSDLANQLLTSYAAVFFLDPKPLSSDQWQALAQYVRDGGSVTLFLGHNAVPAASFNSPAAQELMPGQLARQTRAGDRNLFLAPEHFQHPALATFRPLPPENIPWQLYPIARHWDLEPLHRDSQIILRFGNRLPALVERPIGKGQALVMTTPLSEVARPQGWDAWNELAGENDWPRFALINDVASYLVHHQGETPLNYLVGDHVLLPNDSRSQPERYQLFVADTEPYDATAQHGQISIRYTQRQGTYRLKGHRGELVLRGFSVNIPAESTNLRRLDDGELAGWIGEDRVHLARSREAIEFGVRQAREGRELYPLLILALVLILAVEHLLANRFYRTGDGAAAETRSELVTDL